MYQEQFDNGEISEAQYKTLVSAKTRSERMAAYITPQDPFLGSDNPYNENNFIDDSELPDPAALMTQEEKITFAMKWGKLYKPSEWIELETDYQKMKKSFDI